MSPSPSGSALRRDGAGPWCFKRLRGQARQLVRSRNRSVYPLSGCGVYPYCRRTLVAERLGHGSAEIVDRGRRTTAASDTIRGAFPRALLTVAGRYFRPRKWARSTFRLREAAGQPNRDALRPYRRNREDQPAADSKQQRKGGAKRQTGQPKGSKIPTAGPLSSHSLCALRALCG